MIYKSTDFFKARRQQILSMYNNVDEILEKATHTDNHQNRKSDEVEQEYGEKDESEGEVKKEDSSAKAFKDSESEDYHDQVEKSENNPLQDKFDLLEKSLISDIKK